jgi:hypothetical protein
MHHFTLHHQFFLNLHLGRSLAMHWDVITRGTREPDRVHVNALSICVRVVAMMRLILRELQECTVILAKPTVLLLSKLPMFPILRLQLQPQHPLQHFPPPHPQRHLSSHEFQMFWFVVVRLGEVACPMFEAVLH